MATRCGSGCDPWPENPASLTFGRIHIINPGRNASVWHPPAKTNMNPTPTDRMADLYLAGLRTHLAPHAPRAPTADPQVPHDLGTEAAACGLDTLDLAKIHDQALAAVLSDLPASATAEDLTRRAELFFGEVIMPIEGTHRLALEADADLKHVLSTLERRTLDLADSREVLQQQVAGRRKAEDSLRKSEDSSDSLLRDSRVLEKHLQTMLRKVLSATEAERGKMSRQLNDEVAQSLLGINLRMLALKNEISSTQANFTLEIATIQRLVDDSANMIRRLADEFSTPHER